MVKKVCKRCKIFVSGDQCPICKNSNFSESWKGRAFILNPEKSEIAKKIGATAKGEYALKVR
ncbi:DNA-directed RNA polymerase, subunit E'' [Candidatus Woesearchaeota archaeon]|nr:DNA-directed RNA polymerase, subunit E'' [Candidatus Woesearchaeota archaeon]